MKILLAITGSISAYRSLDICRNLSKEGHTIKVILTQGALQFVKPEVFKYLGAQEVFLPHDDFNINSYKSEDKVLHIELVKWCDRLVIAPASANSIAKISNGLCDDLLSSVFLALANKPCIIFPAMNTNMLHHPLTARNLETLSSLSNIFIHPTDSGELACGDEGEGKLPKPERVSELIPLIQLTTNNKKILITTGATISPLDPVRFITNPSSGLTGYELAKEFLQQGYKVVLVCGYKTTEKIDYLSHLNNIKIIKTKTTNDMYEAVISEFDTSDIYISTAAISDIQFNPSETKLKKSDLTSSIDFTQGKDILKEVLSKRKNQYIIGFAAETDTSEEVFNEKWSRKPVDLLIGNLVNSGHSDKMIGFGQDQNMYFFIKEGKIKEKTHLTKKGLAQKIFKEISS